MSTDMKEIFNEGDVVVLRTGGPEMTVSHVERSAVHAQWFHPTTGDLKGHWFNSKSLDLRGAGT
jgi:uncharacterized protein YodC (DUF2158 family)